MIKLDTLNLTQLAAVFSSLETAEEDGFHMNSNNKNSMDELLSALRDEIQRRTKLPTSQFLKIHDPYLESNGFKYS